LCLYIKLSQYKNLRSDVSNISGNLKKSLEPIASADKLIEDFYLYDGTRADGGKINKSYRNIKQIIHSLDNTILPEIERMIAQINEQIRDLETAKLFKNPWV